LVKKPVIFKASKLCGNSTVFKLPKYQRKTPAKKQLVGVDVFVHWAGEDPNELASGTESDLESNGINLTMITNRGIKVWPEGFKETFCTDHWRCRFKPSNGSLPDKASIVDLLNNAMPNRISTPSKPKTYIEFDGKAAYSLGQGQ
jgi:isocitrate dehydrogenase